MILTNKTTGEKTQLAENEYTVGRSESCDIVIKEPTLSRKHARLSREGSDWFIEDLGSTNGITVNGEKIEAGEKVRVGAGDAVVLGTTVPLEFESEEPEEERTVGVQFFRKDRELEVKERPAAPKPSEPVAAVRPAAAQNAAPVRPVWAENAAPAQPVRAENAAPAQPVRAQAPVQQARPQNAAPARPSGAPMSFKEYVNRVDAAAKKNVTTSAIVLYVCCGITLIAGIAMAISSGTAAGIFGVMIDIAAVLPLAILMHTLKSRGCTIALVCVTALEFILTTASAGRPAGFLPLVGAITALVALSRAKKAYDAYVGGRR